MFIGQSRTSISTKQFIGILDLNSYTPPSDEEQETPKKKKKKPVLQLPIV